MRVKLPGAWDFEDHEDRVIVLFPNPDNFRVDEFAVTIVDEGRYIEVIARGKVLLCGKLADTVKPPPIPDISGATFRLQLQKTKAAPWSALVTEPDPQGRIDGQSAFLLSMVYHHWNMHDKEREMFQKALEQAFPDAVMKVVGRLCTENAISVCPQWENFSQTLRDLANRGDLEARLLLAEALVQTDNEEEAKNLLVDLHHPRALLLLAKIAWQNEEKDIAVDYYMQARDDEMRIAEIDEYIAERMSQPPQEPEAETGWKYVLLIAGLCGFAGLVLSMLLRNGDTKKE